MEAAFWPDGRVANAATGAQPRSLAATADGGALYVAARSARLRASDLYVTQTPPACSNPIGITYEPLTRRVWVACHGGQIRVNGGGREGRAGACSEGPRRLHPRAIVIHLGDNGTSSGPTGTRHRAVPACRTTGSTPPPKGVRVHARTIRPAMMRPS